MKPEPKIAVGEERVVSATDQAQVVGSGLAAFRVRDAVMKLEKPALGAAPAIGADERASAAVPLVYLANHRAWNVA